MRFTQILGPAVGLFAAANAWGETAVWTTVIETDYTTYCPSPTTFAYQNVTYTATSETTITVTNCPCTVTYSTPPPVTTTSYPPVPPTIVPTGGSSSYISYPYSNASSVVITYTPPVSSYLSGTVPVTVPEGGSPTAPTNTPVGPTSAPAGATSTGPVAIPTAAANKVGPVGALLAAGLAALAL
ncbi:hypothetical protein F5Y05DRAFT_182980 [Hypoxylon sp. FL0543]|nr:hypothetical protein F5Y05DRAFT_182980 [Hypoxylon sp. FL0543]